MRQKKTRIKLSGRFLLINTSLFLLALFCAAALFSRIFSDVIDVITEDNLKLNIIGATQALDSHMEKELALLSKTASSEALTAWLRDEHNPEKRALAHKEVSGVLSELYSENLYIGFIDSLMEYKVEEAIDFLPVNVLSQDNPNDNWFFDCVQSPEDYIFTVGIDRELNRKRMWLDKKITDDGETLGVICTGLEFSHIIWELFSNYEKQNMRGIIISKDGIVAMDSALMHNTEFLSSEYNTDYKSILGKEAAGYIEERLNTDLQPNVPVVYKLKNDEYRMISIKATADEGRYVAILSGRPVVLEDGTIFVPVIIGILALITMFAVCTASANYRLVFYPLLKLDKSLSVLSDGSNADIYGLDRDDELGDLSVTINDLFNKAHIDPLTGLYNRRFMENNLQHTIESLSRASGSLSVLMLDIDYFKKYNDSYGHDMGDECLKKVAQALADSVTRSGDFAARYGGEEFIIVLPHTDEAGAIVVAEKVLRNVRQLGIAHKASSADKCVTVSIGVTTDKTGYMQKWQDYVKRADDALYKSKESGRNRYTVKNGPAVIKK